MTDTDSFRGEEKGRRGGGRRVRVTEHGFASRRTKPQDIQAGNPGAAGQGEGGEGWRCRCGGRPWPALGSCEEWVGCKGAGTRRRRARKKGCADVCGDWTPGTWGGHPSRGRGRIPGARGRRQGRPPHLGQRSGAPCPRNRPLLKVPPAARRGFAAGQAAAASRSRLR